jgi:hypothetical protein
VGKKTFKSKNLWRTLCVRHRFLGFGFYSAYILTADCNQTKPRFFVKAPQSGAFTKNLVVGLFGICCNTNLT